MRFIPVGFSSFILLQSNEIDAETFVMKIFFCHGVHIPVIPSSDCGKPDRGHRQTPQSFGQDMKSQSCEVELSHETWSRSDVVNCRLFCKYNRNSLLAHPQTHTHTHKGWTKIQNADMWVRGREWKRNRVGKKNSYRLHLCQSFEWGNVNIDTGIKESEYWVLSTEYCMVVNVQVVV